ncbi:MAG: carboxylesterase/lipase family protein [Steroidobacteraceae bacterium]
MAAREPDAIVETDHGRLSGAVESTVRVWKGIPFARPPVGALRFCAPRPPESWTGVRDATRFGSPCIQLPFFSAIDAPIVGSEDCLTLNVWSPAADGKRRPVLFWIHGGGWVMGTGSAYDASLLAARADVVVVTVNYRLGPWGFLYLGDIEGQDVADSANPGVLDLVAALRWLAGNIARFGGDPDNVTIFGQSAGGMLVGTLLGLPAARGLFHRAIALSGAARNVRDRDTGTRIADDLLRRVGLSRQKVNDLRNVSAAQIYRAGAQILAESANEMLDVEPFLPVVDGEVLPRHPTEAVAEGASREVPLLVCTARDEMTIMVPECPQVLTGKEAFIRRKLGEAKFGELAEAYQRATDATRDWRLELLGATMFGIPAIRLAEAACAAREPVWMARMDYRLSVPPFDTCGATHLADVLLIFEASSNWSKTVAGAGTLEDKAVSDALQSLIFGFAREGRPISRRIPEWPQYDRVTRATLIFDAQCQVERDPLSEQRRAWDGIPLH